ncbi:unnamed protein product [Schistosoma turkestanicum]|nr:unnamed protein product [Schistosoma turkestanicum]
MVSTKNQNNKDEHLKKMHSSHNNDPIRLEMLKRQFILDCIAVRKICDDYSKANPKYGSVIPPYNGQLDPYAKSYFESLNIQKLLKKTGQAPPGTSIEGELADRFILNSAPADYIRRRNQHGCGYSKETWNGH